MSNPVWDALRARDERARRIDAVLAELGKDDEDAAYWYAWALAEPAFRTVARTRVVLAVEELGRSATVAYLDSLTVPGEAGNAPRRVPGSGGAQRTGWNSGGCRRRWA